MTPDQMRRMRMRRTNWLMAYASFASTKAVAEWTPSELFAASEQGVWYDPSDFSTMFQDSAGTTPVTAVEQNVGLIQDKSGNGNHASQATSGSRPVLRARYNLLTYSEQFDNAAWLKAGVDVTTTNATSPISTATADLIVEGPGNETHTVVQATSGTSATSYTASIYAKSNGRNINLWMREGTAGGSIVEAFFNLSAGTATVTGMLLGAGWSSPVVDITDVGDGWYLCEFTATTSGVSAKNFLVRLNNGTGSNPSYTGDEASGAYLWGADLRVTNDGVGLPAYQRVAAATDYDTTGFPPYLLFDGTDDSMATAAIDFSATDEMTVFAGVRKLSDAATGAVVELTTNSTTTTNSFLLAAPVTGSSYAFGSHGDDATRRDATIASATFPAPHTAVLCGLADISGDSAIVRANGVQYGQNTSEQGAGNFANNILSIGRRSSSTLFLNGRLFSLIVRGKTSTADEIAAAETWVNSKTGAY